jgi:alpha-ketoglutarate-dependent taurine dioxygenase
VTTVQASAAWKTLSEEEKLLISGACGKHNSKAKKIKEKAKSQVKK